MYKYKCMNPIAKIGLNNFTDQYEAVDNVDEAEGILVRSANMLEMDFSDNLLAIRNGRHHYRLHQVIFVPSAVMT